MRPSELFNDKDKTEELLCGQNTKQLRNNAWKGKNTKQFRNNWKGKG